MICFVFVVVTPLDMKPLFRFFPSVATVFRVEQEPLNIKCLTRTLRGMSIYQALFIHLSKVPYVYIRL